MSAILKYEVLLELFLAFKADYNIVPSTIHDIRMVSRSAPYDICIRMHDSTMLISVYDYRAAMVHDAISVDIADPNLTNRLKHIIDTIHMEFK